MVAQTPGCRARRSLRRRPGTKCLEWRKKKRSVPERQDDWVGAAFDSITELSTCQHDPCRLTREYMITPSLRDGLLFLNVFLALRARLLSCSPSGTRKTNRD